jgi:hypothetical protein
MIKNAPTRKVVPNIIARLFLDGLAAFQFISAGKPSHARAILKAHLHFYTMLRAFWKKRKKQSKTIEYKRVTSIVWYYFIQRKRYFNDLS